MIAARTPHAQQRRALLAGLLDTDGTVTNTGSVQVTTTSARLADDIVELVVSLGYRVSVARRSVRGRSVDSSVAFNVNFTPSDDVFRLERKRLVHKDRRQKSFERRGSRFIVDVRPVASVPVRCIEVAAADHLYLAGRSMIPTHNSTLGLDIARSAAIKHKMAAVVFSLEISVHAGEHAAGRLHGANGYELNAVAILNDFHGRTCLELH